MCSTRTELSGEPNIIWLDSVDSQVTAGVVTTGSMSTLTFNPLEASDAGTYTCRATLGSVTETAEMMVSVQSKCVESNDLLLYPNLYHPTPLCTPVCACSDNVSYTHVYTVCLMPFLAASITNISITSSGSATAGESYRLECAVTVTGSTDQPVIVWLGPMNSEVTARVVTTDRMSNLTFNPLAASHAGTYTCRAILGSAMDSETVTVSVESECFIQDCIPYIRSLTNCRR